VLTSVSRSGSSPAFHREWENENTGHLNREAIEF